MFNSIVDLKKKAIEKLSNHWGLSISVTAIYLIISIALREITKGSEYIIQIIPNFILVFFSLGMLSFFLNVHKEKAKVYDIFSQGKVYLKGLVVSIILNTPSIIVSSVLIDLFKKYYTINNTYNMATISISITILLLTILSIIVNLMFALSNTILVDKPNTSIIDSLKESSKLMKGNKIKYILLFLSFIGWFIVAILTLGLGLLWLVPYVQMTNINFYLDLKKN